MGAGSAEKENFNTRSGRDLANDVNKTFNQIAKDAKEGMAKVQRTVGPTLEATFEAIRDLSKARKHTRKCIKIRRAVQYAEKTKKSDGGL